MDDPDAATFIALANPTTVLELLDRIAELEDRVQRQSTNYDAALMARELENDTLRAKLKLARLLVGRRIDGLKHALIRESHTNRGSKAHYAMDAEMTGLVHLRDALEDEKGGRSEY
jgi:hypothetical protein